MAVAGGVVFSSVGPPAFLVRSAVNYGLSVFAINFIPFIQRFIPFGCSFSSRHVEL